MVFEQTLTFWYTRLLTSHVKKFEIKILLLSPNKREILEIVRFFAFTARVSVF